MGGGVCASSRSARVRPSKWESGRLGVGWRGGGARQGRRASYLALCSRAYVGVVVSGVEVEGGADGQVVDLGAHAVQEVG